MIESSSGNLINVIKLIFTNVQNDTKIPDLVTVDQESYIFCPWLFGHQQIFLSFLCLVLKTILDIQQYVSNAAY